MCHAFPFYFILKSSYHGLTVRTNTYVSSTRHENHCHTLPHPIRFLDNITIYGLIICRCSYTLCIIGNIYLYIAYNLTIICSKEIRTFPYPMYTDNNNTHFVVDSAKHRTYMSEFCYYIQRKIQRELCFPYNHSTCIR